jgi:hypothetical protein
MALLPVYRARVRPAAAPGGDGALALFTRFGAVASIGPGRVVRNHVERGMQATPPSLRALPQFAHCNCNGNAAEAGQAGPRDGFMLAARILWCSAAASLDGTKGSGVEAVTVVLWVSLVTARVGRWIYRSRDPAPRCTGGFSFQK